MKREPVMFVFYDNFVFLCLRMLYESLNLAAIDINEFDETRIIHETYPTPLVPGSLSSLVHLRSGNDDEDQFDLREDEKGTVDSDY